MLLAWALLASAAAAAEKPVTHRPAGHELSYQAMAAAGAVRPGLVVYLHGSGDDDGWAAVRRDYWPAVKQRNAVLIHPAGGSSRMWLAGEDRWLLAAIDDARKRYGTHPARTVLLGVSGGGQMALYLARRYPTRFACVITHGTNPVVTQGTKAVWFYPPRQGSRCSYFAANHMTQGAALLIWRQVRHAAAAYDVTVNVLPVTGKVRRYLALPSELRAHLDAALTGAAPKPLPDPQAAAVAAMFAPAVEELKTLLGEGLAAVEPLAGPPVSKAGEAVDLTVTAPAGYIRLTKKEAHTDPNRRPLTQVKMEHPDWPIVLRAEGRSTRKPWAEALSAETAATAARGMLYQTYWRGKLALGNRTWRLGVGSMTYPDRRRGWVSVLFISAAAPHTADGRQWVRVLVMDETQKPKAKELAALLKTALTGIRLRPGTKPPLNAATRPAKE